MIKRFGLVAVALGCAAVAGCSQTPQGNTATLTHRPSQAGQGTNPLVTVGHLVAIEAAGLTGDQRAVRGHVEAMHRNLMRDMRLADASRPINHEAARAAVRPMQGVRSSAWIDHGNLLVMVGGGRYRSMDTIDRVCDRVRLQCLINAMIYLVIYQRAWRESLFCTSRIDCTSLSNLN